MYNHFHFSVYAPTKLTANRGDCKLINGIKCLKQFSQQQQQQKHRQVVRCNVKPKVVNVAASVAVAVAADLRLLMAPLLLVLLLLLLSSPAQYGQTATRFFAISVQCNLQSISNCPS